MDIKHKLDALADYMAQKDYLELEKKRLVDQVLTPEIRQAVSDIEVEFAGKSQTVDENIADLTNQIKTEVIAAGGTAKGEFLQAIYMKGRTSWDSKKLEGLAIALPQLLEARTIGEPSVSIRKVG